MNRKEFIANTATAAAAATVSLGGCTRDNNRADDEIMDEAAGLTLEQLREKYRSDLFNRFLPNMDQYVVDHDYGGFMTTVDIQTGEQISSAKRTWYEGRGIWVYSFLYNNIERDPRYLEIARKSKDFILKHRPSEGNFWPSSFSKEGEVLTTPGDDHPWIDEEGDIYGNLFIAEGLAEYAKASGEHEYFELGKEILLEAFEIYDKPDYQYYISYLSPDAPEIPGTRVLGTWMLLIHISTQMLEYDSDPEIEKLADFCIDAIMNHHLNSEYRLLNEGLNHDFSLPDNEFAYFAYLGHGIETLWMVMFEALRRRDSSLFESSRDAFKRHVEVASDPVYGGFFRSLDHVNNYEWKTDKVLWLQEEVLIGTMFLIEHTGDPWAKKYFAETDAYVREKFVRPDYKFWIHEGDRTLSDYEMNRAEHYHHPRHLMLNLLAVERLLERNGRISGVFDS